MWRRINLAIDGFLVGMLFEYTLRVEVSVFPITIGILIFIGILLDFWLYNLKEKKTILLETKKDLVTEIIDKTKEIQHTVPKGWMVYDAGQDPLHMLWYVQLVNFDDLANEGIKEPKQVFVEEADTYDEALKMAILRVNSAKLKKI